MSGETGSAQLSKQEVFDVLEFAQALSTNPLYGLGVYTPDMLNQTLKQLNVNPLAPTDASLVKALNSPNESEDALVGYSEWFDINNMMYKRTNSYLGNMLSFDLMITCDTATDAETNTVEYQDDLKRVYKFLRKLGYKREFKKIVKNMIRQETIFTSLRTDGQEYGIQQLPSKFCKITGFTPQTMLYDFNMYYFLQPAVDIDLYSPVFKKYYNEVFTGGGIGNYIPSNPLNKRNGEFAMWHQTSPNDGFWCFKFSPEIYTKIPYLAPMMLDSNQTPLLRSLQLNKNLASARALVIGEIGFLDPKSGQTADQFNLSPTALSTFMHLVKAGLDDVWSVGGMPVKDVEKFQFEDNNPSMYEDYLKTVAGQSVSMSRAIYANDKLSQTEAEIMLYTDANLMRSLYKQFEDFLYFYANQKTRKYKFNFIFDGIDYPLDREYRLSTALDLADRGMVMPQLIGSAVGLSPMDVNSLMREGQFGGFKDNLSQLLSIHTATGKSEGRPRKRRVSTESRDYDE